MKIALDLDLKNTNGNGVQPSSSFNDEYAYPDFTVVFKEGEDQNLDDAPEEGEMVIRYRRKRMSEDNIREECSYTFCVKEIISVKGDEDNSPAHSYTEAGDALDKLASERSKEKY